MVLDLVMPDSKGLEALQAVKSMDKDLPVVVLTGYPGLKKDSLAMGANVHLEKPFSPKDIEETIRLNLEGLETTVPVVDIPSDLSA